MLQGVEPLYLPEPLRRYGYIDERLLAASHPGQQKRLGCVEVRSDLFGPLQRNELKVPLENLAPARPSEPM